METLSFNDSATEIAKRAAVVEVTLFSPSQPFFYKNGLGEPAKYVPTPEDVF